MDSTQWNSYNLAYTLKNMQKCHPKDELIKNDKIKAKYVISPSMKNRMRTDDIGDGSI